MQRLAAFRIRAVVLGAFLLSLASCPTAPAPSLEDRVAADIHTLYERFPSLRTSGRPAAIQEVSRQALDSVSTADIGRFATEQPAEFQALRAAIAAELVTGKSTGRRAVVSGQSVSGMVAAAILARSGYDVDTYEQRDEYIRNIQWAGRQALVDQLMAIDVKLAELFLKQVAGHLDKGSVAVSPEGNRKLSPRDPIQPGDPARVPTTGAELMRAESLMNMEAKVFEKVVSGYLDHHPHVRRHSGSVALTGPDKDGMYRPKGEKAPDLIVVAEGANSSTRKLLGVASVPTSPARLQVAGRIAIESGGEMVKQWRFEAGHFLLTGTMGRAGAGMTWIVADLNPDDRAWPARKLEAEFRRLAVSALALSGSATDPVVEGAIEGRPLAVFELQQAISSTAAVGQNVIGFGDFVGSNHWSVGGGMQIAVVSHGERLKTLLLRLEQGVARAVALEEYSNGVLEDTMAWGEIGIKDFYPGLSGATIGARYRRAIEAWKAGTVKTPLDALEHPTGA